MHGKNKITLVVLISLFSVGVILAATGMVRVQNRMQAEQYTMQALAQNVTHALTQHIAELNRQMQVFTADQLVQIVHLAASPDDEALRAALRTAITGYFPNAFAFTLADAAGRPLFEDIEGRVGEFCRVDITDYAAAQQPLAPAWTGIEIHPQPAAHHFDVMSPWITPEGVHGIFFVSFHADAIAAVLRNTTLPAYHLVLVQRDQPDLIEIMAAGTRDQLTRNVRLSHEELEQVGARIPIAGTRWALAVIPKAGHLAAIKQRIWTQNGLAWVVYALVMGVLWWLIQRDGRHRGSAYDELEHQVAAYIQALEEANAKLSRREAYIRHIINSVPDALIIVNAQGEIVLVNPQVQRIFGYDPQALIGQSIELLIPSSVHEIHHKHLRQYFADPESKMMGRGRDLCGLRQDGSEFPVEVALNPLSTEAGSQVLALISDITARTMAEEELRIAEERLRLAVESTDIGTWDFYPATGMLILSEQCRVMFNYSPDEEVDYEKCLARMHPEDRQRVHEAVQAALDPQGSGIYAIDYRVLWIEGTTHWIVAKGQVFFEGKGTYRQAVRFTGTLMDITEHKRVEQELLTQTEALTRSNQELQQFAYIASHDLQEPLRMVSSFLQLLQRRYADQLDDMAREYIGFAVDGAQRMKSLINDLLQFSRVDTRGELLHVVDVNTLLENTLEDLTVAIGESQAVITHDPLPHIRVDATQLRQVFQNLISNALKYRSERPPRIHVGVADAGQAWRFSVRDNGVGIEPRYFERIFVIFQRLHARAQCPGTGIGLALCKKIVERHGGHIWVESQPDQGATFSFTLPKSASGPQPISDTLNRPVVKPRELIPHEQDLRRQAGV